MCLSLCATPIPVIRGVAEQHSKSVLFLDVQFGRLDSGLVTEQFFWLHKVSRFKF
jgi:hypothetical protein